MTLIFNDRCVETSTTAGTGTLTLNGAVTGFQTFSNGIGNGNTCYYCIEALDSDGVPSGDWETGLGTVGAGTLARTTVHKSTNSNNAVSFTGTLRVFCTPTAEYLSSIVSISDGDKGDITVSGSGSTWTIDNGAVTLAKQADVATGTVFYRKTTGTGVPEVQTLATLKTDLGLTGTNSGDQDLSGYFLTSNLGVASDVNTGTSTTKAITPDALAGSNLGIRYVQLICSTDFTSDLATGDGKNYLQIPAGLNGYNLVQVQAVVITAGTTGTVDIQIANVTDAVDMLSTKLTIDSTETSSTTAATAAVIDTTKDDVATGDLLRVDLDALPTTKPKGLIVTLGFQLP